MRNLKKFLALVLAMMMTLSLMVTVNAANVEFSDSESVTEAFQEDITVLNGMGVIQGYEDGSFGPQRSVTRGQMAAFIYRIATGDATDKYVHNYVGYNTFTDVSNDDWFAGYIGYCANAGYIVGYGDGTFKPFNNVTGYQALAMILRAMGYNEPGHNFTGTGWETYVSSTATQRGMLVNVNKTNYKNSLRQVAPRELVAELTFQGVTKAMVQYTPAFGYQTTGMSGGLLGSNENPSLGLLYYGLTCNTGIVVGNQATGERWTKLGLRAVGEFNVAGDSLVSAKVKNGDNYNYASTVNGPIVPATPEGNVTITYNADTGLDLFGHKVNMWYDCRTNSDVEKFGNTGNNVDIPTAYTTTYAVIDKATLVKTVWADDLKVNEASSTSGKTSVYSAAVAQGFSSLSDPAWASDRFAQMNTDTDNAAIQSKVGMYTVISNNDNKTADVVISLNQEVAQITQRNTTVKDGEYIYLGKGASKFGNELVTASGKNGLLLDALLAPGSDVTLSDVVTANEVVGTAVVPTNIVAGDAAADHAPAKDTASTINAKYCRYETSKLEPAFTGTVATYTLAQATNTTPATNDVVKVVLTNNESYDLSGITGANLDAATPADARYQWDFDDATHLIDGALDTLRPGNTYAGVTYSFYTDAVGRFIGVSIPNDYKFLYTTFADYEIGGLGTGTSGYYVYGVDWDGNIVKDKKIVSITEPTEGSNVTDEFDDLTPNTTRSYPNATESLAVGYNNLPVTLKDLGNAAAGVVGNQIRAGVNTRFMVDPNGDMTWYPESAEYGERFLGWWDGAANSGAGAASYTWTITSQDVANGFKRVYNHNVATGRPITAPTGDNTDYLLTDSTKFIVVTGSGTSDLSVKTYNGIGDLVGSASYAEISIKNDFKGDNVYFITSAQRYGNVNTDDNHSIDTVILSNTNLNNFTTQSLFFSEPGNAATGVKLASDPGTYGTVNQYKLYNNGELGYYWVSDTQSTGPDGVVGTGGDDSANGTTQKGDFYTLTPIGEVNGQIIYKATVQAYSLTATICDVDELYDYIVVNDLSTAAFGPVANNVVKKVTGANVTVALGDNYNAAFQTLFPNGINITDLQTLNNAVSMGKAGNAGDLYSIKVAFEYSGVNVSNIYVTAVTATPSP